MTSCIEYVFLENFVINYITIFQVSTFTKFKAKKINMLVGIILLSFYATINYYLNSMFITNILIKILTVSFCIYIIYLPKELKKYIRLFVYYFLISFLLVGIVISLTLIFNVNISNIIIKNILYIVSGILLFLFNKFMWKMWKSKIKKDDLIYIVKIEDVFIPAFVDTGNNVYDYVDNLDVIFIEKEFLKKLLKKNLLYKKIYLNVTTITRNNDDVEGYIVKNIVILKNKEEVCRLNKAVFVFIDKKLNNDNEYNALISYDTYIDKMKGVILC